jgi:ferredoxin-like protein FixX
MKFICDAERCIECNGCVTACKAENDVPWGVNRRRVVTLNDGLPGEKSISVACMHGSDAPCMAVCPVDCFYRTAEGVVLQDASGRIYLAHTVGGGSEKASPPKSWPTSTPASASAARAARYCSSRRARTPDVASSSAPRPSPAPP